MLGESSRLSLTTWGLSTKAAFGGVSKRRRGHSHVREPWSRSIPRPAFDAVRRPRVAGSRLVSTGPAARIPAEGPNATDAPCNAREARSQGEQSSDLRG